MNPRTLPLILLALTLGCATQTLPPPADENAVPQEAQALFDRATLGRPEANWALEAPLPDAPKGCHAYLCRDPEGRPWRVIVRPPAAIAEPPAFVRSEPLDAPAPRVGAYADFLPPEPEQRDVFAKATQGTDAATLRPEAVATQVVAGTNYHFRCVTPDGRRTYSVFIFRPLPHTGQPPRLTSIRETTP